MSRPKVSFFTPGRRVPHQGSYIIIDQTYVQYRPALHDGDRDNVPILFIHGGGLTGAQWESTPDLRPGWACLANKFGHDAYLLDTVDNGRSARAPDHCRSDSPIEHRTAKEVWTNFRFGAVDDFEQRKAFEGGQFPIEHFDALLASQVSRRRTNDMIEAQGIEDVLEKIRKCFIIAHSHGAALVMDILGKLELQDDAGSHVQKLVFVEPGPTSNAKHISRNIPTLVLWGDNVKDHKIWPKIAEPFERSHAEVLHLPDVGVYGNSHFPMSERNSDEVFELIIKWLKRS